MFYTQFITNFSNFQNLLILPTFKRNLFTKLYEFHILKEHNQKLIMLAVLVKKCC